MKQSEARAAVERSAAITGDNQAVFEKLVAALRDDDIIRRAALLILWERSDEIEGAEDIFVAVLGERVAHEPCGSLNLPGSTHCWGCEEPLP